MELNDKRWTITYREKQDDEIQFFLKNLNFGILASATLNA